MTLEDESWLLEHLFYEWSMLNYTIGQVQTLPSSNVYNANYESFAVHARLISLFLTNRDTGNYGASDFVQNFRSVKPDNIKPLTIKIDAQVMHLSPKRPTIAGEKLNSRECDVLFSWLEGEFRRFFVKLPEEVRIKWIARASKPATITISDSSTTATNHIESATISLNPAAHNP